MDEPMLSQPPAYQKYVVKARTGELYEVYVPVTDEALLDSAKVREEVANIHISPSASVDISRTKHDASLHLPNVPQKKRKQPLCEINNDNGETWVSGTKSGKPTWLDLSSVSSTDHSEQTAPDAGATSLSSQDESQPSRQHPENVTPALSESIGVLNLDTFANVPNESCQPVQNKKNRFVIKRHKSTPSDYSSGSIFDMLPEVVMVNVFRFLTKPQLIEGALVCKKWRRIAYDESLWRRLELSARSLRFRDMEEALSRGARICRMAKTHISGTYRLCESPDTWRLQYLDLTMAVCEAGCLEAILSGCSRLKKLSLESCYISDVVCRSIGRNPRLQVLNMCMAKDATHDGLLAICQGCQNIEAWNLSWSGLTTKGYQTLCANVPRTIQRLNIAGGRTNLRDKDVATLCGGCPELRELDLSDCTMLSEASVLNAISQLRHVEYLGLSRCYYVSDEAFLYLGEMKSLLAVEVNGVMTDAALDEFTKRVKPVEVNKFPLSSIARPTTGIRRTSIWGLRVRDS